MFVADNKNEPEGGGVEFGAGATVERPHTCSIDAEKSLVPPRHIASMVPV